MAAVDFQKPSRAEDGDTPKTPELSEVQIPADHDIGARLESAFEDTIVRLVVLDCMNRFLGLNELRELPDGCNGVSGARG